MLENQICTLLQENDINPGLITQVREMCSRMSQDTFGAVRNTMSMHTLDMDSWSLDFPAIEISEPE